MPIHTIPRDYEQAAEWFYRAGAEANGAMLDHNDAKTVKHPYNPTYYDQSFHDWPELQSYAAGDGTKRNVPASSWWYAGNEDARDQWPLRGWRNSQNFASLELRDKPDKGVISYLYTWGWRNYNNPNLLTSGLPPLDGTTYAGLLSPEKLREVVVEGQRARVAREIPPPLGVPAKFADYAQPARLGTALTAQTPAPATQPNNWLNSLIFYSLLKNNREPSPPKRTTNRRRRSRLF